MKNSPLVIDIPNFELDNHNEYVQFITHKNNEEGLEDNYHVSLNVMKGGLRVGTIFVHKA